MSSKHTVTIEQTTSATTKRKHKHGTPRKPLLLALEPRVLFDGAALATAVDVTQDPQTAASSPADSANPTETNTSPEFAAAIATTPQASDTPTAIDSNQIDAVASLSGLADSSLALAQPAGCARNELVVVDGGLANLQTLLDEITEADPNRTLLVLDPAQNENDQLTTYLQQHTNEYDAIHVLSHGGTGFFSLGNQTLDLSKPEQNATLWNSVKTALTENGDVLLYGCNVGSDVNAQTEVTQLAQITGADFAVSTDVTGASGNWVLEYRSGSIETSSISATDYAGDLASMSTATANIDVNEGSPYVVFRFTGSGGVTRLTLSPGTATGSGVDFGAAISGSNLQYSTDGGVNWYGYSVANGFMTVANAEFLVRTPLVNDTLLEGPEGFSITASVNSATASANVTIHDDGTGQWFTGSSGTGSSRPPAGQYLDGDMPLSVNSLVVNEGSPYAIWSVTYGEGKVVKLTLSDGTQAEASQMGLIGAASVTNDLTLYNAGHQMETSVDGGTTWSTYTAGSGVAMGESCNLLVRVKVNNDTPYEVSEVLNLDVKQVLAGTANTITDNTVGLSSPVPIDNIKVVSGASTLDSSINLITNGDFSTGVGSDVRWAPAVYGPNVINGWTASGGGTSTYAYWTTGGGAPGAVVYFGNQSGWTGYETGHPSTPYLATTVFGSGNVTATPMTFTPGYAGFGDNAHPLALSQTIDTTVGKTYRLQFTQLQEPWGSEDGIAAIEITGSQRVYFRVYRYSVNVYTFEFTATSTNTNISFMSWGHVGNATELKLDTVIVNEVPEALGTLTILDNGQGNYFNGDRATPLSSGEISAASIVLNDDRAANPIVNDITVNEGSPYAVFTVNGLAGAVVELSMVEGTDAAGSTGADVSGLQVSTDGGANWANYNASNLPALNADGILFVRTVPVNDAVYEQTETVTLTATYTGAGAAVTPNGADSGVATIKDDGTGQWFAGTGSSAGTGSNTAPNGSYLNDERPVTVTGFSVNEASPYGIFTVNGAARQYVQLTLADGTAHGASTTTATDGSVDYSTNLQYYNGTSWMPYTAGSYVQLDSAGKLLVRTAIVNDTPYEGAQTLTLAAANTQGTVSAPATGTIKDDGTGSLFSGNNTTGSPDSLGSQSDLPGSLNDDRPPAVNNIEVNEGSPYAVFAVADTAGRSITLSLTNGTAKGGSVAVNSTASTYDYGTSTSSQFMYSLDGGTTWLNYTAPFASTLTGNGVNTGLLVRTTISNDTQSDNGETFKLTAVVTGTTLGTTGTATIHDDGTGQWFTGLYNASTNPDPGVGSNTAPANSYLDDDTPVTVNNITVNEGDGTNYAVFTVSAKEGQRVKMALGAAGTQVGSQAATTADYINTMEYWDGTAWVTIAANTYFTLPSDSDTTAGEPTNLLVRVKITDDATLETTTTYPNGESFKLTAYNGSGVANMADANGHTGICWIKDDGTGTIYQTSSSASGVNNGRTTNATPVTLTPDTANYVTAASAVDSTPLANDDRTLSVNAITVNEGSKAVFTVTGMQGQYIQLQLSNNTANGGTTSPTDGTVDYLNNSLQYWDGTAWQNYTQGDFVKITDASGTIKVRAAVVNDATSDNSETFYLQAANTGGTWTAKTTTSGQATIKDDGTGTIFDASGNALTNASAAVVSASDPALANDDRAVTITSVTVNEGSPYAEFTVGAVSGQYVKLDLASGTATKGVDFNTMEYWNGTAWTAYTADTFVKIPAATMKVRVAITNDTVSDNGETFTLTASNTNLTGAVGTGTIKDDGTGTVYSYTSGTTTDAQPAASALDDDRPLTVTGATVNEASPYLVFEVAGVAGQYMTLVPETGTAILGTDTTYAGSTSDKVLQYFDGTSWVDYTAGSKIQIPSNTSGKLLVRTKVVNDGTGLSNGPYEMAETIKLTATNTGGGGTTGLGTIVDNGTGSIYLAATNSFTPATSGTDYPTSLDDDRYSNPAFVNNVVVNEGSPYVVFTVSGVPNANVNLSVTDATSGSIAVGGSATNGTPGAVDYNNTVLEYYNTRTGLWTSYNASTPPALSAGTGELLVRIPIFNDTVMDGGEKLNLTVQYPTTNAVSGLNTTLTFTGTAQIVDDGTGSSWSASATTATPLTPYDPLAPTNPDLVVDPTNASKVLLDDDRPVTVNDITVNEGSPYAVFTVTAKESQYVKLEMADVTTVAADHGSTLQYWNGSQWVDYTAGTFVAVPNDGDTTPGEAANLLVRVAITNDSVSDNGETLKLTAYNTTGAANVADSNGYTGVCTIKDDGTGTIFSTSNTVSGVNIDVNPTPSSTPSTATGATAAVVDPGTSLDPLANDDRPLTVHNVTVNEASPYATFTVTGAANQYVKLDIASATATVGTDTGAILQYFDGSAWVVYTAGTFVKMDGTGALQTRVAIINDTPYEGAETFKITAYNTNGTANVADSNGDTGIGTIMDNGTGLVFAYANNSTVTPNAQPAANALDNDRTITINNLTVNEGSPYAVFMVSGGVSGQPISLSLANQNTDGADLSTIQYWDGSTWQTYTSGTVQLDTNGSLQVRVALAPEQETALDGGETFNLVATKSNGLSTLASEGLATIVDDGTGTIFADSGAAMTNATSAVVSPAQAATTPLADDDRPLTVNDVDINEGSYAVFTVGAREGQYVKLSLGNTAPNSDTDATLGSDLSNQIQYWDGSAWVNYSIGDFVKVPGSGTAAANLMVRVLTTQDAPFEDAETFTLTATNTGGGSADGLGTIHDDGTGDKWSFSSAADAGTKTASGTLGASFDDDRPTLTIGDVTVSDRVNGFAVVEANLSSAAGRAMSFVPFLNQGGARQAILGVDTGVTPSSNNLEYSFDGGITWAAADAGVTFAAGQTSVLLRSAIVGDATTEGVETYLVNATGLTVAQVGTVSITDNPTISISNVTVNEASPYAVVEVSLDGAATGNITFTPTLSDGTGTAGTDASGIEYYDGSAWVTAANGVTIAAGQTSVLLRTAITHDTLNEVSETVQIVTGSIGGAAVLNTSGVTGTVTIVDQGSTTASDVKMFSENAHSTTVDLTPASGAVINPTTVTSSQMILDDDRPLHVNNVTVNEASPYIVFSVTGAVDQYVKLSTADGTAVGGSTTPLDGSIDYGTQLQYLSANGAWVDYIPGSFVKIPNGGTELLVRTTIVNDTPYEISQSFNLVATNTGGGSTPNTEGIGTIKDDGTGGLFSQNNTSGTPDALGSQSDLPVALNDDRPVNPSIDFVPLPKPEQGKPVVEGYRPWERRWEQKPIELGQYEFHTIVLDFNGQHGGINQFRHPESDTTSIRGALEYSNHTPYTAYDRVGDEVNNANRALAYSRASLNDPDMGLRNVLPVPDVAANSGKPLSYRLPASTFTGGKGDVKLTAVQKDGTPLPAWLKFNPKTGHFEGDVPADQAKPIDLRVIATDDVGGQAEAKVRIKPDVKSVGLKGKPGLSAQLKAANNPAGLAASLGDLLRLRA